MMRSMIRVLIFTITSITLVSATCSEIILDSSSTGTGVDGQRFKIGNPHGRSRDDVANWGKDQCRKMGECSDNDVDACINYIEVRQKQSDNFIALKFPHDITDHINMLNGYKLPVRDQTPELSVEQVEFWRRRCLDNDQNNMN